MPYISQRARMGLDPFLEPLIDCIDNEGEANYVISRILTEAPAFRPVAYQSINTALGVLWAVGLEFYRRLAGPYEDHKAGANGDLPGFSGVPQPDRTPGTTQAVTEDDR